MKLSGDHASLIDLAKKLIKYLDSQSEALKVSPGIIISKRSATARNHKIKVTPSQSGLDLTITQNATIQKIRIFTADKNYLTNLIQIFCQQNKIDFSI